MYFNSLKCCINKNEIKSVSNHSKFRKRTEFTKEIVTKLIKSIQYEYTLFYSIFKGKGTLKYG